MQTTKELLSDVRKTLDSDSQITNLEISTVFQKLLSQSSEKGRATKINNIFKSN